MAFCSVLKFTGAAYPRRQNVLQATKEFPLCSRDIFSVQLTSINAKLRFHVDSRNEKTSRSSLNVSRGCNVLIWCIRFNKRDIYLKREQSVFSRTSVLCSGTHFRAITRHSKRRATDQEDQRVGSPTGLLLCVI